MIQDISGRILNGEAVGITGDETFVKMLRETENNGMGRLHIQIMQTVNMKAVYR